MQWIIRPSLRFAVIYGVLLAMLVFSPLGSGLGQAVGWTSSRLLGSVSGHPILFRIAAGKMIFGAPPNRRLGSLDTTEHTRNLPLFLAVILAVATAWNRRLLALALAGIAVMFILDATIVASDIWSMSLEVLPGNRAYYAFELIGLFHITGGAGWFVAPVFIGALAALGLDSDGKPASKALPSASCTPAAEGDTESSADTTASQAPHHPPDP